MSEEELVNDERHIFDHAMEFARVVYEATRWVRDDLEKDIRDNSLYVWKVEADGQYYTVVVGVGNVKDVTVEVDTTYASDWSIKQAVEDAPADSDAVR